MELPQAYQDKMKQLLKESYPDYLKSFEAPRHLGLRVNTLKITPDKFEAISPFNIQQVPWTPKGYYYGQEEQPAKHPYYFAGLYYLQEPSAMTPATFLPIEAGDKVLDLCAAPGGKSTELGAKLQGTGVLVSNDISASRAKALLKNIELAGITNSLITSEPSHRLAQYFEGYFDKILVDAPCSGEGMFRKDPSMIKNWEALGVAHYEEIQKPLIEDAIKMLKPGGLLLYSTCTFSPEENEGIIQHLLDNYQEISVMPLPYMKDFDKGRPEWVKGSEELKHCVRLWPHKIKGEGHFVALLRKWTKESKEAKLYKGTYGTQALEDFYTFADHYLNLSIDPERLMQIKEDLYYMPEGLPDLKGLRLLRTGLYLGTLKKKRFEPSQAFAMGLTSSQVQDKARIQLPLADERVVRYLKGESFPCEGTDGWKLVMVDGFSLGWGKLIQNRLKNKYYSGWRWL